REPVVARGVRCSARGAGQTAGQAAASVALVLPGGVVARRGGDPTWPNAAGDQSRPGARPGETASAAGPARPRPRVPTAGSGGGKLRGDGRASAGAGETDRASRG